MRKVLSFVLVLTLVLSSFSMAFAATTTPAATTAAAVTTATTTTAGLTDISGSANSQAIEVASNLGIVTGNPDGTFQPEKAVTRAEFAAMITRALGIPSSALAGYTSTSFKDCSGYGWAVSYLAFCQSKGIMLGDGAGNAMPGKTINTNEAATMICRALGYTSNSSQLTGVWPANYVSLAQDLGIYDDTAKVTSVDKQNAAQMIYNALSVQKVQVASDGTTTKLTTGTGANAPAVTMLTSGLNCKDKGYDIVSYDADAVISTVPHVGECAKTYENKDGDLISVDDVQGTVLKGKFTDVSPAGLTADDYVTVDDVDYTFGTNYTWDDPDTTTDDVNPAVWFDNGDKTNTRVTASSIMTNGKEYTFNVELSNKTIKRVYSIEKWNPTSAAKVVAGDLASIKDGKLLGVDFAQDKKDNIVSKSFELVGVKSLNDIKADNVVYVYKDTTRKEISKVSVGTQVVEGTVTKVNAADKEWTVGGKVYSFELNGDNGSSSYKNELNNAVKLYLDADGHIYKYDVTSGSAKDYATVLSYNTGGTYAESMKLYLASDSKKTYPTDLDNWTQFEKFMDPGAGDDAADYGRRLIGYSLDKSGNVDGTYPKFDKNSSTPEWGDNDKDGWYTAASKTAIMPSNTVLKGMTQVAGKVSSTNTSIQLVVDPDAVVFTYETYERDGSSAGAINAVDGISKVNNIEKHATTTLPGTVEALVRDGKVVAMIIWEDNCSGSTTDSYAVVSKASDAVNPAGDKAQMLEGFIDGKEMAKDSVYTSGQSTVGTGTSGTGSESVNVYKLKYNDDKNISKMTAQTPVSGGGINGGIGVEVTKNGYVSDHYIKTGANGDNVIAISDKAVYYEVVFESKGVADSGVKEYKAFNGTIYAGMRAWVFDPDDDVDGADIVVIDKGNVSTYSDLSLSVNISTASIASNAALTTFGAASVTGGTGTITYTAAYNSGTTVTFSATPAATTLINSSTGVLTINPTTAGATKGAIVLDVTAKDGVNNTSTKTVTITIY